MKIPTAVLLSLATTSASASVVNLTDDNWETATAGKTVFVKFFAPWCGHCKAMAADWEQLGDEWKGHAIGLIAEVDCTTDDTEALCEDNDIEGFPSIKYGDMLALEDYEGGRDYDSLSVFAKENLKPICSPANLDACSDENKAAIEKFQAMSEEELIKAIEAVEEKIDEADDKKDEEVMKLQETYERLMDEHDAHLKEIKSASHYGLMKSVLSLTEEGKEEL
eukprot:CAMPEP_0183307462 /NCGR_PEP_ID=MMETSP0160_2-20130417/17386_1 /TAXON_ID=2839 ORGANISM="Odontella Sinensis, Strain Grunow 1884" /NCGR_SAMPLE_ID=MMETSP0160_2 /ASSEMBLY_ACC=CAM_ASM_000250 /LENGTH=221 /DNA_ID=CAMNT_0025471051 /DNA_START=117 /DNA_END=782 /DNA_ORIENTATION=-